MCTYKSLSVRIRGKRRPSHVNTGGGASHGPDLWRSVDMQLENRLIKCSPRLSLSLWTYWVRRCPAKFALTRKSAGLSAISVGDSFLAAIQKLPPFRLLSVGAAPNRVQQRWPPFWPEHSPPLSPGAPPLSLVFSPSPPLSRPLPPTAHSRSRCSVTKPLSAAVVVGAPYYGAPSH